MKALQSSAVFVVVALSGDFFSYTQGRHAMAWAEGKMKHTVESYKSFQDNGTFFPPVFQLIPSK